MIYKHVVNLLHVSAFFSATCLYFIASNYSAAVGIYVVICLTARYMGNFKCSLILAHNYTVTKNMQSDCVSITINNQTHFSIYAACYYMYYDSACYRNAFMVRLQISYTTKYYMLCL